MKWLVEELFPVRTPDDEPDDEGVPRRESFALERELRNVKKGTRWRGGVRPANAVDPQGGIGHDHLVEFVVERRPPGQIRRPAAFPSPWIVTVALGRPPVVFAPNPRARRARAAAAKSPE